MVLTFKKPSPKQNNHGKVITIQAYAVITEFVGADINECAVNNGGCSADAVCTDNEGGFSCECNEGFEGDGFTCTGMSSPIE